MSGRDFVYNSIHGTAVPSSALPAVPAGPFAGYYAAEIAGITLKDYVTQGRSIAEGQLKLQEKIGHDILVTAADTYYIAEGFGLEVEYYENALPTSKGPLLDTLADCGKLKVLDPGSDGRMPVYLEAARILRERVGDSLSVRGTGTGPFSLAAYLLGIERFLMKLMDFDTGEGTEDGKMEEEEGLLRHLLEIMTATSLKFLDAQIGAGADILYLGDSLASLNMISPAIYRKYVFPYHREIFQTLKKKIGTRRISTMIHMCGNNMDILSDMASTGVDLIEIDSAMDLAEVKAVLEGKAAAIGNLDPVSVLKEGSADEVERACLTALEKGTPGGRFILGSGCFVCPGTPVENLRIMVGAAHGG
jgi:uroporphyrinogen decarboxylase